MDFIEISNPPNYKPIQILSYDDDTQQFELNTKCLATAILEQKVGAEMEIAIVSITGVLRKGKSFLLNLFLRYLNETYEHNQDAWLDNEDTELLGFSWRGGSERNTIGLWIWPKIFTKVLLCGKKIGVMLMDTQGIVGNINKMQENITIFALSTLLSSVQIYNLSNNIQEDDLQYLQLLTEYGKLAYEEVNEKAFQKLLFLVRDWDYPYEKAYGFKGGEELLEKILQRDTDQTEELIFLRKNIKSCFEKLSCFLMPYPGRVPTSSAKFAGQLHDLDSEFKNMVKVLIPALLAPENVLPKKINGFTMKAESLVRCIHTYWRSFGTSNIPKAQTILAAATEFVGREKALNSQSEQINNTKDELIKLLPVRPSFINKAFQTFYGLQAHVEKRTINLHDLEKRTIGNKCIVNQYNEIIREKELLVKQMDKDKRRANKGSDLNDDI